MKRLLPILLLWLSACASSTFVSVDPTPYYTQYTTSVFKGPHSGVVGTYAPGTSLSVVGRSGVWLVVRGPGSATYWIAENVVTPGYPSGGYGGSYDAPTPIGTTHDTYTGPRGGHYYYNGNGNKTYVTPQSTINSHNVQTGPRGGQYYINSHGNKTYIKH
jgi:hypothetical protein